MGGLKRSVAAGGIGVVILLAACTPDPRFRPGDEAVYERLAAMKDCDRLKSRVEGYLSGSRQASGEKKEIQLAYMLAARARMRELEC